MIVEEPLEATLKLECSREILESLQAILDYLCDELEEEEDFEAEPCAEHVFTHIRVIQAWLRRETNNRGYCRDCGRFYEREPDNGPIGPAPFCENCLCKFGRAEVGEENGKESTMGEKAKCSICGEEFRAGGEAQAAAGMCDGCFDEHEWCPSCDKWVHVDDTDGQACMCRECAAKS